MTKTIDELAKQYAKLQTDEQGYGSMEEWKQDIAIYYDDAKSVLSWLFAKPFRDRLTAEEKEQIRFAHKTAKTFAERTNPMSAEVFKGQYPLLESIFGADFFKEEE